MLILLKLAIKCYWIARKFRFIILVNGWRKISKRKSFWGWNLEFKWKIKNWINELWVIKVGKWLESIRDL